MMDDACIISLFVVNVVGIAGVWHGVDGINKRLDKFTERLTRCETTIGISGGETDG